MTEFPRITPPDTIHAALVPLCELSDAEFDEFAAATSSARAFTLTNKSSKTLQTTLPALSTTLPYVLGALSFLYGQIESLGDVGPGYSQIIQRLVEDTELDYLSTQAKGTLRTRLERLLQKNPSHTRFKKIQRLQQGFLPNATTFRSMVDLRPDFGDTDALELKGFVKIIQLRITTDSSNPEEREIVFQLSEEALSELSTTLERTKKKLEILKAEPTLALKFTEYDS